MNSESFTAWQMPVFDTPETAAAPAPAPAVDA
ncbi:MAG: flagellar assembly protein FliH, partial [Rhodocyclaceae bacterium]|nr:flagellar assembly protein FliH [Rhodocyclaceae bacterium]